MAWILAYSKPNQEKWALENLTRQNCEYYHPKVVERVVRHRKSGIVVTERTRSLFGNYIFVQIDGRWQFVNSTWGIAGIVMSGQRPAIVRESIIEDLRKREGEDGFVRLPGLSQGDRVRVKHGTFAYHEGIYEGMSTKGCQRVLLELLGRKVSVAVTYGSLEKV